LKQEEAGIVFNLKSPKKRLGEALGSHHWLSPTGEILISYRYEDSFHWLGFPNLADFQLSESAKEITCFPQLDVSAATIRHLLLDQVLPRCLSHQGKSIVHASAVRLGQGTILFLGASGAGKSTLAGNFHQAGAAAISDDCVWIKEEQDQLIAVPSYRGLRLWDDSLKAIFDSRPAIQPMTNYSAKKRVLLQNSETPQSRDETPLRAVFFLYPATEAQPSIVSVERLSQRDAFMAIVGQTFQLDLTDLERIARQSKAVASIVRKVPLFRLALPHDFDLLTTVRQKIAEAVLS
jgi:hypothetical protein